MTALIEARTISGDAPLQKREHNMYRRLNYLGAKRQLRSYGAASQVSTRPKYILAEVTVAAMVGGECVLFMVGGVCHVRVCAAPAAACAAAAVHAESCACTMHGRRSPHH